jgi:hypothetical protein
MDAAIRSSVTSVVPDCIQYTNRIPATADRAKPSRDGPLDFESTYPSAAGEAVTVRAPMCDVQRAGGQ